MTKNTIAILFILLIQIKSFAAALPSIEERVDQLENSSLLQQIQWNGSFEYRFDSISDKTKTNKSSFNPMRIKVLFDASTQIDPAIQFYSRFGLTKYTNDYINQGDVDSTSFDSTRSEKGTALLLERAFVNYSLTSDVVASLGRLPTIDGTPTELWDNSPRLGTYPLLSYGAILDGVALSYNWGFLPTQYKFSTRFIYTPLYNVASDTNLLGNITSPTYNKGSGPILEEKTTLFSVMADFETKAFSFAKDFNLITQLIVSKDYHLSDQVPRGTDLDAVLALPSLGTGGNGIPGNSYTSTFAGSTLRFNFDLITISSTISNIANTNLTIGLNVLHTRVESHGYIESSAAIKSDTDVYGSDLQKALGIGQGIMTNKAHDEVSGNTILTTFTYLTPFTALKNPLIGAEYVYGSKNVQYFGFTNDDLTRFYSTRGNGYHLFWSQPMSAGTIVRIGLMNQDHHYSKGYVGAVTRSTLDENTIYGNFKYNF